MVTLNNETYTYLFSFLEPKDRTTNSEEPQLSVVVAYTFPEPLSENLREFISSMLSDCYKSWVIKGEENNGNI